MENTIFITGGAYQGKLQYFKDNFKTLFDCEIIDFKSINISEYMNQENNSSKVFYNCQEYVKWAVSNKKNAIKEWDNLIGDSKSFCVIMNQVGNGIVPIEKEDRIYREEVGRFGCYIASKAMKVIVVTCGIGNTIKGHEL